MRLLLDEMHAPVIARTLADEGWPVAAVASEPVLRGLPDEELLAHSAADERVLVTENVDDFAPIAARWAADGRDHGGLVFTNPRRFNRAALAYPGDLLVALRRLLMTVPELGPSATWWL